MFCWLIGHNWVGGYDPHFQSCTRCARVRPRQFKGCQECQYCSRPINKPPTNQHQSGSNYVWIEACPHCGKKNRWEREYSSDDWGSPTLIIDFKMDTLGE